MSGGNWVGPYEFVPYGDGRMVMNKWWEAPWAPIWTLSRGPTENEYRQYVLPRIVSYAQSK